MVIIMLIHIVKTGETVDKITDSYRILKSDLISNNQHITDFSHLKSGMKLKIPLLSKDTLETLEETEAFIDDYYPSFEKFLSNNETIIADTETKEINNKQVEMIEEVKDVTYEKEVEVTQNEEIKYESKTYEQKYESKQEVKDEEQNKSHNNNVFQYPQVNYYRGNVIPNYNQKYIKKI